MYTLVLVRHGESQWNLENRFTGWTDVDLTEKGREEAREAGKLLREGGYDFDVFYASLTWAISPDYINESGTSLYYGGDIIIPIQEAWTARGHVGFQFVGEEGPYLSENATDWSAGIWYNWSDYDVDFGLQYIDTDLDESDCVEHCGGRAVFSAAKDFSW